MSWYQLVGTSHIAEQSLRRIEKAFTTFKPNIVAVELDQQRLHALISNQKPSYSPMLIPKIGLKAYLFALIGGMLQRRLGRIVGLSPGSDMLKAVTLAHHAKMRILLIDQHIQLTLRMLNKAMGWQELKQVIKDFWRGLRGERLTINLTKVPDSKMIQQLLGEFEERYPRLYYALVEHRNQHMAAALKKYHELNPHEKILVVVGAGHLHGLKKLLAQPI